MTSQRNPKRTSYSMRNLLRIPEIHQLTDSSEVVSLLIETMSRVNGLLELCDQYNERIDEQDEEIERLKQKVSELEKKTLTKAWTQGQQRHLAHRRGQAGFSKTLRDKRESLHRKSR